ncbi:hypothetical protein Mp_1g15540 [Marchantia polymorpha subsp. ruderalis]|uniref:Uncharacterized protein n=2 Tax=Marchantia polymorpha TaxID=3197 RepID=A0AAF6AQH6_MARPO|nr:hypothetical protein MARPO_0033s0107 [Marchantia polymorpha]BBM98696.1 hypothetical protein Mp_1g15540 [Marchantia polymorpha subsp. ruderalis]|eukprot:PTQ41711.1 hypothetical protein MARPO_0033s0107 [Marchantia polymorpha]
MRCLSPCAAGVVMWQDRSSSPLSGIYSFVCVGENPVCEPSFTHELHNPQRELQNQHLTSPSLTCQQLHAPSYNEVYTNMYQLGS